MVPILTPHDSIGRIMPRLWICNTVILCLKLNKANSHFLQHNPYSPIPGGSASIVRGRRKYSAHGDRIHWPQLSCKNLPSPRQSLPSSFPGPFSCQAPPRNSQHRLVTVWWIVVIRLAQGELRTVGRDRQIASGLEWPGRDGQAKRLCAHIAGLGSQHLGYVQVGAFCLGTWTKERISTRVFNSFSPLLSVAIIN